MKQRPDPFETLRALNPVDPDDLRGESSSVQAQNALEQIVTGIRALPPPTRRSWPLGLRRRRKVYLIAVVPLAAAVAAGAWALTHGATKSLTIGCYASASLEAQTAVVPATGAPPTKICSSVWRRGDFGPPRSPRLQACVLASGAIGVFPSPDGRACEQLRLVPLQPVAPTVAKQRGSAASLKDALVDRFLIDGCMGRDKAMGTIRSELRKQGLDDWAVSVNEAFSAARPCASLGFDEEQHRVLLIPMPRP